MAKADRSVSNFCNAELAKPAPDREENSEIRLTGDSAPSRLRWKAKEFFHTMNLPLDRTRQRKPIQGEERARISHIQGAVRAEKGIPDKRTRTSPTAPPSLDSHTD
ncbi:hypothetical protein J2T07_003827 [Luteibacter jiangsuensis]|uniref:Uncharacterized protein n=1 Tax=Luteibacter jiangsuensis TaxID=637577 RepID=A0ABT9T2X7_9GAMM|nr:hypothetical protein [Luteibacter jiangsuensis]MDQ0011613.1 hypothetical protein [Luteibacter jiangsuensis]